MVKKVLGIESSCDETSMAILETADDGVRAMVLANKIASQMDMQKAFGGVIPEIAAREHLTIISSVYKDTLQSAGVEPAEIDLIAVTAGPGLIGALLVGNAFARGLALRLQKPLIGVDHVHAHIYGALLNKPDPSFPALALVVSGGHTHLYEMASPTEFKLLRLSLDDACGESFDKVARLLGLSYPGGPVIDRMATKGDISRFKMPLVDLPGGFSYSGLKTHMLNTVRALGDKIQDDAVRNDLCAAFQKEAIEQILRPLERILGSAHPYKSIIIAGGVAANSYFRRRIQEFSSLELRLPEMTYCADNGAMIGALGARMYALEGIAAEFRPYSRYRG